MHFFWTIFLSDPFDFRPQKRDKEVAPSWYEVLLEPFSPLVFKYAINRNCIGDLYLWCEGQFLEVDPTPPPTHRSRISPLIILLHPATVHPRCAHLTPLQLIWLCPVNSFIHSLGINWLGPTSSFTSTRFKRLTAIF